MARLSPKLRARISGTSFRSLKPNKKFVILFVSGVFSLLLLLGGSVQFTSRPAFCTSCHYMQPFYDSWAESSHSDVKCTTCHFPPGLKGTIRGKLSGLEQVVSYVGRSYTRRKPWAEIDDASCLQSGCHDTRTLDGVVNFKGVVFDHSHHLNELRRGKELRCTSCHSQVVQGDHIRVTESTCFLCHMKKEGDIDHALTERLSTCTTCHNWEAIPEEERSHFRYDHTTVVENEMECVQCHSNTMIGDGFVPLENCNSCHFEVERLDRYDDTDLMHRQHIAISKIECSQCHLAIQHRIQRVTGDTKLECATCHDDTHAEQLELFTGNDREGQEGTPNPMLEVGLSCENCHVYHRDMIGQGGVQTADGNACESCHGKGYGRLLRLWEESSETKIRELSLEVTRVRQTVRGSSGGDRAGAQVELEGAEYSMRLVQVGKAVHNMTFADELIGRSYEHLNTALEMVGASYRLSGVDEVSLVPSECANCHTGLEVIETTYRGRSFDHNNHVIDQEIACATCHSNAGVHGQTILSPAQCNSCHHDSERRDVVNTCANCHETQAEFYAGTYLERDYPDYMFDGDITCDECHMNGSRVIRPTPTVCVDCHDDDYAEMLDEWKEEIVSLVDEIRTLMDQVSAADRSNEAYQLAARVLRDLGKDAVNGVHNYEMTVDLLTDIEESLSNITPTPDG